jgi:predicted DNA-binding transcriptional regulator YafY
LLKAINEQQEVMMHYQRFGNTQVKHYRFQPYVLKEYRNRWYVTGYAVTEKSIRTFALERIKDLIQTHEHFDLSFDFNPEEYFRYSFGISVINGYMPEDIELSFSSKQAAYIKSKPWHHTQKILKDNDEEFRISMQVIPSYELREQILAYGDEVKVIKPLSLKKLISDTLHQAAKNYKV